MELAFEEFGSSHQPPLIILHGFFASSRNWRHIARKMSENFHVFVLDLRNHGLSPHSGQMTYPLMATDLENFLDQQQLPSATILGHSMGGKVAMWFALTQPERMDNLVVVDIAPVTYTHSFNNIIQALQALPLQQIKNRKQAENYLQDPIPELFIRQFLLQNLTLKETGYAWRIDLDILNTAQQTIIAFPDVAQASAFTGKTLFLSGGKSDYINTDHHPLLSRLFTESEIQILPDAGHWLHAEQPELFLSAIDKFFA